jgi:regulator of cell morphogenesis and NO signaling
LLAPIDDLKAEHDAAGTIMQKIRMLTNNYEAPEQACTTHRLTLASLKAFEEDLHQHVHLENNILFPKAISLVSTLNVCSLTV